MPRPLIKIGVMGSVGARDCRFSWTSLPPGNVDGVALITGLPGGETEKSRRLFQAGSRSSCEVERKYYIEAR